MLTSLSIIYMIKEIKIFSNFISAYEYQRKMDKKYSFLKYDVDLDMKYDFNTKNKKYIVSVKNRPPLKYQYSISNIFEDELDDDIQKDLVDEINDLYENVEGIKKAKRTNFVENMRNSRHDKNVYCDICGKYQTRDEYKKYKMCKKCYNS